MCKCCLKANVSTTYTLLCSTPSQNEQNVCNMQWHNNKITIQMKVFSIHGTLSVEAINKNKGIYYFQWMGKKTFCALCARAET